MDFLGPVSRIHEDGFDENDEEINGPLEKKHQKHRTYSKHTSNTSSIASKTAYKNMCETVPTKLRDMQDSWLSENGWWNPVLCRQKDYYEGFFLCILNIMCSLETLYGP